MKAIILAAGKGTHMGLCPEGVPACMLPFGEQTLLERIVESLGACGVEAGSIIVVLGYGASSVVVPAGVAVVENPDFDSTDNSYSLRLALKLIEGCKERVAVLDANMVVATFTLKSLFSEEGSAALVQEGATESCRTGVLIVPEGRILSIGKHLPTDERSFAGAMVLSACDAELLLDKLEEGRFDQDWYTVPLNELVSRIAIQAHISSHPVVKVGTDEEFFHAKRVFGIDKLSILLVGASGFLGSKMKGLLSRRFDVVGTSRAGDGDLVPLDPLDEERLHAVFEMCRPDTVVNLVGFADPDACDADQATAYNLNVKVVQALADECRARNASLIQISTDYVFDGAEDHPYDTCSERRQKSYYGTTKMIAEDIAISVPKSLIVRTPILYGYNGTEDKLTFPMMVLKSLKAGKTVTCDDTQVRYPVLIDDVCEAIADHILDSGILHVSSVMPVTKYQWARVVAKEFGFDESLVVVSSEPLKENRPVHVCLSLEDGGFRARDVVAGTRVLSRQLSCSFDLVYRQRPLTYVGTTRVADFRIELGKALAAHHAEGLPQDADCVVPVPESGLYYAMGLAERARIPYVQALVKQNSSKRSFQLASYSEREVVLKSNVVPMRELVEGKRVILVDEAIFTGVTIRTICDVLKASGALSIDVYIPTPVCATRCPYGVQPNRVMLAETVPVERMAEYFRIRSVRFGSWETFEGLARRTDPQACVECFAPMAESS